MTGVRPPSTIRIFVRLKARLVVNGVRRMTRSTWARVGFAFAVLGAVGAAALGFGMALGLRSFWDPHEQHRILVLVTFGIVMGWWFGPILSGGVDETIDPARLSLLPLTRRQIRTGQIAAGFVGLSPLMVVTWVTGIVVGMARSWSVVPMLTLCGVVVLLAALVGSRSLSTSLARLSRSRRGGDLAALIAVLGGSIQGLEDLHHGFPVERVGQRHRGFAFETVTGAPAITWGDFEEVFDAGHSGTYLSGHNTRGWPSEAMQQSLSPARRNHSLPPCVDAIDEALPIDSGTYHDNVGNRASIPFARSKIFSQTIGKRKGASRAPF